MKNEKKKKKKIAKTLKKDHWKKIKMGKMVLLLNSGKKGEIGGGTRTCAPLAAELL
jgi:hypothetical protein